MGPLATLPTCAHLSPDSQARLHRAGSVPCKPKTLKMSAYGTFSPTARPQGSCQHRGRCPPAFATWQGCREKPPAPLPQSVGSPPTCKGQAATRFFTQALTGFQLRPLRLVLLPHGDGEGQGATKSCIFTLTPWNRPNTHRRGRWIGFATCPCGLLSEWGLGQSPRACFVFEVVRVDVTVQKGQKNVHFRIFATKNTANLANF